MLYQWPGGRGVVENLLPCRKHDMERRRGSALATRQVVRLRESVWRVQWDWFTTWQRCWPTVVSRVTWNRHLHLSVTACARQPIVLSVSAAASWRCFVFFVSVLFLTPIGERRGIGRECVEIGGFVWTCWWKCCSLAFRCLLPSRWTRSCCIGCWHTICARFEVRTGLFVSRVFWEKTQSLFGDSRRFGTFLFQFTGLDPGNGCSKLSRNIGKYIPLDTASCPRRSKPS